MSNVEKLMEKWRKSADDYSESAHKAANDKDRGYFQGGESVRLEDADMLEVALAADREGIDPRAGLYKQVPTSCICGGNMAWVRIRESGAEEMVGCICHTFADREGRQTFEQWYESYPDEMPYIEGMKDAFEAGKNAALAAQPIPEKGQELLTELAELGKQFRGAATFPKCEAEYSAWTQAAESVEQLAEKMDWDRHMQQCNEDPSAGALEGKSYYKQPAPSIPERGQERSLVKDWLTPEWLRDVLQEYAPTQAEKMGWQTIKQIAEALILPSAQPSEGKVNPITHEQVLNLADHIFGQKEFDQRQAFIDIFDLIDWRALAAQPIPKERQEPLVRLREFVQKAHDANTPPPLALEPKQFDHAVAFVSGAKAAQETILIEIEKLLAAQPIPEKAQK